MLTRYVKKSRQIKIKYNELSLVLKFKENSKIKELLINDDSKTAADEIIEKGISIFDIRCRANFNSEAFWNQCPKYLTKYNKDEFYFQAKTFEKTDVKYLWEIGRIQYLVVLAKAYRQTGEDKYINIINEALNGFINNTVDYKGVQWQCPMDVALRLVSLTSIFILLDLDISAYDDILIKHLSYMLYHDEWNSQYTGNHHLICVCGILYTLASLRGLAELKSFYYNRFKYEIGNQFGSDGGNFESSISYHYFVSDAVNIVHELYDRYAFEKENNLIKIDKPKEYNAQIDSRKSDKEIKKIINKINDFSIWHIRQDGTYAKIGDDDSGYFVAKQNIKHSHNPYNKISKANIKNHFNYGFNGKEEYQNNHIKEINIDEEVEFETSKYFSKFGSLIVRSRNCHVSVSLTRTGQNGKGGHDHLDLLHSEIWVNGKVYGRDPGVSSYTYSLANRNRYRSSLAHNTPIKLDVFTDLSLPFKLNKPHFDIEHICIDKNKIRIEVTVLNKYKFCREIKVSNEKKLIIADYYNDDFLFKKPFCSDVQACNVYGENVNYE